MANTANIILKKDEEIKRIDDIYTFIISYIDENATTYKISVEDISILKEKVAEAYIERKSARFMEKSFGVFCEYFDYSLNNALNIDSNNDKDFIKLFYVNHTKHLLTNEQY